MFKLYKKAGPMDKVFIYGIVLILISIFAPFFIGSMSYALENKYPIPQGLEINLIHQALVNSCFAYEDEATGRQIQNVLDVKKLNNDQLKSCLLISLEPRKFEGVSVVINTKSSTKVTYVLSTDSNERSRDDFEWSTAVRLSSGEIVPATIKVSI
jgi:hypothetical protein